MQYVRGRDMGGGVGGLLYSIRGTTLKYNHSNGRGDIVAHSDSTGALSWTASYEAYGQTTKETNFNSNTNADTQRANSKDEEKDTSLLNEGYRYRDLETGVWLSRDPAGFVDGPNLYAYVQQNPWSKFDAEGLFLSALVTAGFAAYDTYQYATGKISGSDYAGRMALNGAALVADAASGGLGGGLAVRMTATGSRAVTTIIKTAKAVDKANDLVENVQTAVETGQSIVEASEGEGRGLVRAAANALEDAATKKVLGAVAKKPTGSYTNTHESGKKYHGMGTEERMNTSAKEKATEYGDPVVEQDFKPAADRREAFKDEARRIREDGGVENPENYNKINSPGEKYLKQDGE